MKCLTNRNAAPFEFNVNQRKSVDKNRHVIAVVVLSFGDNILIDNLNLIIVNIGFVNQHDIFG